MRDFAVSNDEIIIVIGADETYKYLDIIQAKLIDHTRIKNELTNKFIIRFN